MATAFDSFDKSALGGFIESPLAVRGQSVSGLTYSSAPADVFNQSNSVAVIRVYHLGSLVRTLARVFVYNTEGREAFTNVMFGAGLQIPYYIGMTIGNLGATEFTGYTGERKLLVPLSLIGRSMTFNTVSFLMTSSSSGGRYIAMTNSETKTGTLFPNLASVQSSTTGNYSSGDEITVDLTLRV
jgi:hypothetical protein